MSAPPATRLAFPSGGVGLSASRIARWAVVLFAAAIVLALPRPEDVTEPSWRIVAIFVGTIAGLMVQPVPGGAVVLLGVTATALTGALTPLQAFAGYSDPVVWVVLGAFFMSRGMIKSGLGRRIALWFIRALGRRSLGLGYSLGLTDVFLASFIPSNSARAGGIVFPIAKSLAEAYESRPGESARRLGAFLMVLLYQMDVMACAMFITGQASNPLIARFAAEAAGVEISFGRWFVGAAVPGLVSLAVVPVLIYMLFPPQIKHTPQAAQMAIDELSSLGRITRSEKLMLAAFGTVAVLWMTSAFHGINYAVVALLGVASLLVTGVLDWQDVTGEHKAWDVFIWYGGLVTLAGALAGTGVMPRFAQDAAAWTDGWPWALAFGALLIIYFYAHYAFASVAAHATAMYTPFLLVMIAAGVLPLPAALLLAYASNLMAGLTHYGTTPGPIYFGAGYVSQASWWEIGFVASTVNLIIWAGVGALWWRVLGWW